MESKNATGEAVISFIPLLAQAIKLTPYLGLYSMPVSYKEGIKCEDFELKGSMRTGLKHLKNSFESDTLSKA